MKAPMPGSSLRRRRLRAPGVSVPAQGATSRLLATMGHDLRTPLNSIIGFSRLMADSTSLYDEEKHSLQLINEAGHSLLGLINDLVDLSKIDAAQLALHIVPVDLHALLAELKTMAVDIDPPRVAATVMLDAEKLRRALHKLLAYSRKLAHGRQVRLALTLCDTVDDQAVLAFTVSDAPTAAPARHGAQGVDVMALPDTARTHGCDGASLMLARGLVQLLGGQLRAIAGPEGTTQFHFSLIARRPHGLVHAGVSLASAPASGADPRHMAPAASIAEQLQQVAPVQLRALHAALQHLDLRQVEILIDAIAHDVPGLARDLQSWIVAHRYRELCSVLERVIGGTQWTS